MRKHTIELNRPIFDLSFWIITFLGILVTLFTLLAFPAALILLLAIGLFLYLGFGLPRWVGRKKRILRALTAKRKENEKWGFHSQDREGPWINFISYPLVIKSAYAKDKYFYSEWLVIHDGMIILNPGQSTVDVKNKSVVYNHAQRGTYAWDGCSPKRFFFWFAIVGTPDWWNQEEEILTIEPSGNLKIKNVFWQKTHLASLVHDALYQYLDHIPIAKDEVDHLFYEMLCESRMNHTLAKLYYYAVHRFGGRDAQT